MKEISEILIKDLINQGIKTFFGVQGGACARLVKSVVKLGGTFHPVLNEQLYLSSSHWKSHYPNQLSSAT